MTENNLWKYNRKAVNLNNFIEVTLIPERILYNKYREVFMPHLKIRGMAKEPIIKNSKELIDGLTNIVKCDRTWFTIEHIETEYIFDGKIIDGYTFVELFWFERTPEVKKKSC